MKKLLILTLVCAYGSSIHAMDEKDPKGVNVPTSPLRKSPPQKKSVEEIKNECKELINTRNYSSISDTSLPFQEVSKLSLFTCVILKGIAEGIRERDHLVLQIKPHNEENFTRFVNSNTTLRMVEHILNPLIEKKQQ